MVECTFPGGTTSAGFQVIAQQSDSSKVHKLHTNHTLDHSTPVTITVEERGMYQVNVLGISEGDGLVDSRVEYTGQVMVDEEPETIANPTIATPTTLGMGILLSIILSHIYRHCNYELSQQFFFLILT